MMTNGFVWQQESHLSPKALWTQHVQHSDERGSFTEIIRASVGGMRQICQVNVSKSRAWTLRGMHWHKYQTDYWYIAGGRAQVMLANHDTKDFEWRVLREGDGVVIPPPLAHGFLAIEDMTLIYGVTKEYNRDDPDEQGFHPYSMFLTNEWMGRGSGVIMSDRDRDAVWI